MERSEKNNNNADQSSEEHRLSLLPVGTQSFADLVLYSISNPVTAPSENDVLSIISEADQEVEASASCACPLCGHPLTLTEAASTTDYFYMLENLWHAFCRSTRYASQDEDMDSRPCPRRRNRMLSDAVVLVNKSSPDYDDQVFAMPCGDGDGVGAGEPTPDWTSHGTIADDMMVPDYYKRFFLEVRLLGAGSYGVVYLCQHHIETINLGLFAVKKVPIGDSKLFLEESLREIKVRESITNPNLIDYKHSWIEPLKNCQGIMMPWLFILCEFANSGDIESLIEDTPLFPHDKQPSAHHEEMMQLVQLPGIAGNMTVSEVCVWVILYDILNGLRHLHRNLIMHRDLKLANVMINVDRLPYQPQTDLIGSLLAPDPASKALAVGPGRDHQFKVRVLIADFGTAVESNRSLSPNDHSSHTSTGHTGTLEYASPELLEFSLTDPNLRSKRAPYTIASELWSVGIMLYTLIIGAVPWRIVQDAKQESIEIINTIQKCAQLGGSSVPLPEDSLRKSGISDVMINVMKSLLRFNPGERPTANSIIESPTLRPYFSTEARLIFDHFMGKLLWNRIHI
eukprot:GHVH01007787.1.p1 GENE.GHVH01007787.1~~GHVH01007787.1.p1  ORF type:complete len:569 (+),score=57.72 GHVH01007787.1:41-1747(+)